MSIIPAATQHRGTSEDAREISRALRLHPLVARLLVVRGVTTAEAARGFLSPRLADLTRPDAMADRELAAERLASAVKRRQRVVVFGDYDVDGITSAALLTRALRQMGGEVSAMVASRFDGGYGLSDAALDRALALRPAVLVTCDCGTSDHPRLARARAAGVDCVVVDHHKVPDEALPAMAFLNPHRPDCGFPYKHLASVGLAFSVSAAVRAKLGLALDLRPFLDLVALGTVADVAPLDGDNRILVRAGLQRIGDHHAGPGLTALLKETRLRFKPTSRDVGFSIAPLLNAPGRLGAATPTLELLLADDPVEAARRAAELSTANARRREISARLVDEALTQVRRVYGAEVPAGVVVSGEGWHEGMGGIVAGRLVEQLGAAVAVVAVNDGLGVGSVRAPRGVKVYDAVRACAEVLEGFGGHDAAAGLRVRAARVEALRERFASAVASTGRVAEVEAPRAEVILREEDLTPALAKDLLALEPTGEGNPEPVVEVAGARLGELRGVAEAHLRAGLSVGGRPLAGFIRDGVRLQHEGRLPSVGSRVDVVGALRPDPWNGDGAVQVEVRAIRATTA